VNDILYAQRFLLWVAKIEYYSISDAEEEAEKYSEYLTRQQRSYQHEKWWKGLTDHERAVRSNVVNQNKTRYESPYYRYAF